MKVRRTVAAVVAATGLTLAVAACGDDDAGDVIDSPSVDTSELLPGDDASLGLDPSAGISDALDPSAAAT